MADEVLTPETPAPSPELYEPEAEVIETRDARERPEPKVELEEIPVESEKPETPAEVKAEKHSADSISQAARLGIPAEDIDDMSPKELARMVTHLNRFGQAVWNEATKQPAKAEETPKPESDEIWDKATEDLIAPELVAPIKKMAAELKALRSRDKEVAELKEQIQAERVERIHSRIETLVANYGSETSEALDRSTAKGQESFKELMITMKFVQDQGKALNKNYTEKEILERSIRQMGLPSKNEKKPDAKDAALKEREKEFKEGALGQPTSRNGDRSLEQIIQDMARKRGMAKKQPVDEPQVEWHSPKSAN